MMWKFIKIYRLEKVSLQIFLQSFLFHRTVRKILSAKVLLFYQSFVQRCELSTIISMEESGNQEQIFENLKLHKEVLSIVKQQPWPLRRKIKLVRQAKAYVRQHEGALQERFAQSRSTKDAIVRVSLLMTKVRVSPVKEETYFL